MFWETLKIEAGVGGKQHTIFSNFYLFSFKIYILHLESPLNKSLSYACAECFCLTELLLMKMHKKVHVRTNSLIFYPFEG